MNKIALITGGTRGIGKQIALTLAKEGYDIAINYRTQNNELEETKKEIEQNKVQCFAVQGDVSNYEECENFVKEVVEHYGTIDVLVNNAGITKDMLLMRMKKEDFEDVIDVNNHDESKKWKNYQYFLCSWNIWQCRANQLFSLKSRYYRLYQKPSQRSSLQKHTSKCYRTWVHSN